MKQQDAPQMRTPENLEALGIHAAERDPDAVWVAVKPTGPISRMLDAYRAAVGREDAVPPTYRFTGSALLLGRPR